MSQTNEIEEVAASLPGGSDIAKKLWEAADKQREKDGGPRVEKAREGIIQRPRKKRKAMEADEYAKSAQGMAAKWAAAIAKDLGRLEKCKENEKMA